MHSNVANVSYNYSADLLFKEITIIYNMLNVSLNDIPIIEREDELWTIKCFSTTAQSSSFTAHHFHVMIGLNVDFAER